MKNVPLEKDVLRSCLDLLAVKKLLFWRQNAGVIPLSQGGYRRFVGRKGLPDIFLILPPHGTLVAIEVKRQGKKMSRDQILFHDELVAQGGVSICVTSSEQLEEDLKELGIS